MSLPIFLKSALYSYDLATLNPQRDSNIIITQILNHGDWPQVKWVIKQYGLKAIKKALRNPGRGLWYDDVLNYWQVILGFKLSRRKINRALFSLKPV